MDRRVRVRRLLKWVGTVGCVVLLLGCAASLKWYVTVQRQNCRLSVADGAIFAFWVESPSNLPGPSFENGVVQVHWWSSSQAFSDYALCPRYEYGTSARFASMPLWIPLFLIGAPTAVLWRLDRRRVRPGRCGKCDYDLTGNESGRCPECGTNCGAKA